MQLSQISDDELVDIFTEIGMIGRDSNIFVSLLTVKSKKTWNFENSLNPNQKTNLLMFYAFSVR